MSILSVLIGSIAAGTNTSVQPSSTVYLSPNTATVGSSDVTITLRPAPGRTFPTQYGIVWNGPGNSLGPTQAIDLSVTYSTPTEIRATIPASVLSVAGAAPISVDVPLQPYGSAVDYTDYPVQTFVAQPSVIKSLTTKVASSGGYLVDGTNSYLQLRGFNLGGIVFTAVQNNNPIIWGGIVPRWAVVAQWKPTAVRIPLNAGSWLGHTTYDIDTVNNRNSQGQATQWSTNPPRNCDPQGSYRATVIAAIQAAQAIGCRVVLDLHWSMPILTLRDPTNPSRTITRKASPSGQPSFMNADTDLDFWNSMADTFGTQAPPAAPGIQNDGILFELFNEPYINNSFANEADAWALMLNGGTFPANIAFGIDADNSGYAVSSSSINILGYQTALNAIRAKGAHNVCIINGTQFTQEAQYYTSWFPTDTLNPPQLAHGWHSYPYGGYSYPYTTPGTIYGKTGADRYNNQQIQGNSDQTIASKYDYWFKQLIANNIPVLITEDGGAFGPTATQGEPHVTLMTNWADTNKASYFSWNFTGAASPTTNGLWYDVVTDSSGNYVPSQGQGTVVYNWLVNHT